MNQEHTRLRQGRGVTDSAASAARVVAENGGSPRAQIDAARAASGERLGYLPHCGAKERAHNLRRLEKAAAANSGELQCS